MTFMYHKRILQKGSFAPNGIGPIEKHHICSLIHSPSNLMAHERVESRRVFADIFIVLYASYIK